MHERPLGAWRRLSWRHRDHTQGNLLLSMLVLALPSIATSLGGAITYQLVDLAFLSRLGPSALAAVVVTNQTLRQGGFLLLLGLSLGAQMLISRIIGENESRKADQIVGQVLLLGLFACVIFALAGGLFPGRLLGLVTRDPAVLALGVPYVRLSFVLIFGFVLAQLLGSMLLGSGDSTTPLLVTLLTTPIALFAEWCLIFGHLGAPPLGTSGVAWGAALGATVGLAVLVWVVGTGRCRIRLRPADFVPDWALLRLLCGVSWKASLHLAGRTLVIVSFMAIAGRLGSKVQAAYGIGIRLQMVVVLIAFPIANACATLVGQNLGAGRVQRAWSAIRVAMAVNISVCWSASALFYFMGPMFMASYASDPEVIALGSEYLRYAAFSMLLTGPYFVAFRALQGAGDMLVPMLFANASAVLVAVPLGAFLALRTDMAQTGLWTAMLSAAVVNAILTLAWLLHGSWTKLRPTATLFINP